MAHSLKIAILQEWHATKMGYVDNFLPKALAALGHEVHLVTTDAQPYFNHPDYRAVYEPFLGPAIVPCQTVSQDGYTLHRLRHGLAGRYVRITGLFGKLREIRPQVVQTFEVLSSLAYEAALYKLVLGYKLFVESHVHASVFPPARQRLSPLNWLRWKLYAAAARCTVNAACEKCYPISNDCAEIAVRFLGVSPRKIQVYSLGVDTTLFHPASDEPSRQTRESRRQELGFAPECTVCTYSGRLSEDKGPLLLAQAIDRLNGMGHAFGGLFVGAGPQDIRSAIEACRGCVVRPFVPVQELPPFYWAADVGVWPRQESTSQLDAAASGLPLVLSDRVQVKERVDGNGLTYREMDVEDLCRQLLKLADPALRLQLGQAGAEKVRSLYDWTLIARQRAEDYEASLTRGRRRFAGSPMP